MRAEIQSLVGFKGIRTSRFWRRRGRLSRVYVRFDRPFTPREEMLICKKQENVTSGTRFFTCADLPRGHAERNGGDRNRQGCIIILAIVLDIKP